MLKKHKDNVQKRLYTRAAKFYNAMLISFLVASGCSFALRNISTKISIILDPLSTSLNDNNSFFTVIMFFDDLFRIVLSVSLVVALIGIFREKDWARYLFVSLYGIIFMNQLAGLNRLLYRSILESVTQIPTHSGILLIEATIFLGIGVILVLRRPILES